MYDRAYIVGLRKIACKFSNSRQRNSSRVSFSQIFVQKSALRCRVHFHLIIRRKQKEQEMKIWKSNGEMKIPSYNIPGKNPINQGFDIFGHSCPDNKGLRPNSSCLTYRSVNFFTDNWKVTDP